MFKPKEYKDIHEAFPEPLMPSTDNTISEVPIEPEKEVLLWDTPKQAYHSTRVICDEMGLSVEEKNLICACIYQESQFNNEAVGRNKNANGEVVSTDWGIVQVNDYWNIGANKPFPSVQYVLDNPEFCVRWMIRMYSAGKLSLWASYKYGAYKRWLAPDSPMWSLKT